MILAGDIGGTNTRLAVFDTGAKRFDVLWAKTFPSKDHANLADVVRHAASEARLPIDAAGFGIAGPVRDGRCRATNLPWVVDSAELADALELDGVGLVNDLEANAWGLSALGEADLLTLHEGDPNARGNAALIAAGTGLGEAGLFFDGSVLHPFACEGGHASFAPTGELQLELAQWLAAKFGHVSWERVLSGPGLVNLYEFLRDTQRGREPAWLAERISMSDPAAAITQAATSGQSELAIRALELFVTLYGSEAGNLALKAMATGGVFVGGGIAPRIASWLAKPMFLDAFANKGRMRGLLESIPVRVVLNDKAALIGAARHTLMHATVS